MYETNKKLLKTTDEIENEIKKISFELYEVLSIQFRLKMKFIHMNEIYDLLIELSGLLAKDFKIFINVFMLKDRNNYIYSYDKENSKSSSEINKVSISFIEPFVMWNRDHMENLLLIGNSDDNKEEKYINLIIEPSPLENDVMFILNKNLAFKKIIRNYDKAKKSDSKLCSIYICKKC